MHCEGSDRGTEVVEREKASRGWYEVVRLPMEVLGVQESVMGAS